MEKSTEVTTLLKSLNFVLAEGQASVWVKSYSNHANYQIKILIDEQKIDYGNLITLGDKTTCNFKASENFVVLECVNRLLEKGYSPQNIILEKIYPSGHGTSGKLDILVTRDDGTAYLMIECKTFGDEFTKEFKRIKKDGGQIFTYFQQDKNADVIMLYASQIDKKGSVQFCNEIIKIEDAYRQTGNVKDFYERWNNLTKDNGVFDDWVNPYDFQSKALTPENLKDIPQGNFIFDKFLEILRHNVVSDKPNAFNKIFTLFLCKIYDEKTTKDGEELAFQWFYTPYKYEGSLHQPDDNISFQKRLTDLYKNGMKDFLEKDVIDISDADFERKYGNIDTKTKQAILNEIVEIRLKKNNEFAIKEVFDNDSFEENAKVVKEVVELLQGFKIRYTKKQQYLSDFFELLLTTGLKQESGQFFTPVPVAQFIIKSLPLDKIISDKLKKGEKNNLLPTVIDYAAGSGHFITEVMHEIHNIIKKIDAQELRKDIKLELTSWKDNHFNWAESYIYGVEKDYRLVKVGKVGCYLHGDGLAQIIHSDGLANFANTKDYKGLLTKTDKDFPNENKQFDIVISNPPYSVSAFKNNASKYYSNDDFELYDNLTDQSSEIECLFIERTKQLLKDGGIAGIILPSSILSNTGIYTKTREIILQYFEIVAITELGSNTFMATGTNTVILFLRRRNNYDVRNLRGFAKQAITEQKNITINQVENSISKYVAFVWEGINYDDYISLLQKKPNQAILEHEIFNEYKKKIKCKNDKEFWDAVINLETEKLYYFVLTYPQKIVLVKTGEKDAEKQFLGYEFSNRRGSEGIHPTQRGKQIDECTRLFDAEIFNNPEKASTYIYQAFNGNFDSEIHEDLQNNITRLNLVDTLTFDRVDFEKTISLSPKKKVKIETKWELVRLRELVKYEQGLVYGKSDESKDKTSKKILTASNIILETKKIDISDTRYLLENVKIDQKYLLKKNDIFICTSSGSRSHLGKSTFIHNDYDGCYFGGFCAVIRETGKINIFLVYQFLQIKEYRDYIEAYGGQNINNLRKDYLLDFKIPLPPKKIQQKIVSEIEVLEERQGKLLVSSILLEEKINNIIQEVYTKKYKKELLGNITEIKNGGTPSSNNPDYWNGNINWATLVDTKNKYLLKTVRKISNEGLKHSSAVLLPVNTVIFSSRATIGDVSIAKIEVCTNQGYKNFICDASKIHYEFLYYILKIEAKNIENLATGMTYKEISKTLISEYKIPLPPFSEQQIIVTEIEKIERELANIENELAQIPKQKEAALKKYL